MRDYERILRCGWADVLMENITFTSHLFILKVRYLPVGKVGMRCGWARYNKARKIGLTVAWFPELTFCKTFLLLSITIIGTLNLCLFAGDFPPAPSIPQKKNQITMSTTFQRPCSPTQARHSPSPARRKRV